MLKFFSTFDAWVYIKEYYGGMDLWHGNALKYLHEFYTSHFERGANLKILNYGCGPIVAFEASAAPYAREIVLADYLEQNRAVVKLWLDKNPSRPDFSPLDRYVVEELEGLGPDEVEARQDAVRRLVTVCSCDIFQRLRALKARSPALKIRNGCVETVRTLEAWRLDRDGCVSRN